MTNISEIIRVNALTMTNQQLADLALVEDQEARRARREGRLSDAAAYDERAERLARMLK